MTSRPTSVRLSPETARQLSELCELMGARQSAIIARLIVEAHHSVVTGDAWVGTGIWSGWRISSAHSASSYNQPVLVRPDGVALGPGDVWGPHEAA